MAAFQAVGDEKIGCYPDGALDHIRQRRRLPGPADPPEFPLHVDVLNGAVGCDDPQCCGIGSQLVVRVAEIWIFLVVDLQHGLELALDLGLDIRVNIGSVSPKGAFAFAENEKNGALDVFPRSERSVRFRSDSPGRCHPETCRPEDQGEIRPDIHVLMGEHDELQAVVGHVLCQTPVAVHHCQAKVFIRSLDSQGALAVGIPLRKKDGQTLFIPGQEEFGEFLVIDGIGIRGIGDPEIGGVNRDAGI
jgi:hypothetical protein